MRGDLVAPLVNLPDQLRAPLSDPAKDKKCCRHIMSLEEIKNLVKPDFHSDLVLVPLVVSDDAPKGLDDELVFDLYRQHIEHDRPRLIPDA